MEDLQMSKLQVLSCILDLAMGSVLPCNIPPGPASALYVRGGVQCKVSKGPSAARPCSALHFATHFTRFTH